MVQFNYQHPFQNHVNNISQMLLHFNLLILYSTSLMLPEEQIIRVIVVNIIVFCGVFQFILMIIIHWFSFNCCKVNVIRYVQQKLLNLKKKKSASDINILLTRQDFDNAEANTHNELS